MKRTACLALALSLSICSVVLMSAQSVPTQITPNNATGIQPYNSYGGVRENISLATGDLNIYIPLLSLPGRNGFNFELAVVYDSKIWDLVNVGNANVGDIYDWITDQQTGYGPRLSIPMLESTTQSINSTTQCITGFIFVGNDGSKHSFGKIVKVNCYTWNAKLNPPQWVACPTCAVPQGDDTVDESFMHLDATNPTDTIVYAQNGNRYHFTGSYANVQYVSSIEDANGNLITFSGFSFTDTLKRQVNVVGTNPTTISYLDSSGTSQTIVMSYTSVTLAPTFNPVAGSNINPSPVNRNFLSQITLPNQRAYSFAYNNFGELTEITYPTGGYTKYEYAPFTAGYPKPDYTSADFREVTKKHVCFDPLGGCSPSTEVTTTYTPTIDQNKTSNQYMDVQKPLGRLTHHQFPYGGTGGAAVFSPKELSRSVYDNGNALLTVVTTYNSVDLPATETTTLQDVTPNLVKETTWTYDIVNGATIDNVTNESEYDYGSGAPGPLLRQTVSTYLHTNPVNGADYTANTIHILDRKLTENIEDGASSVLAQTKYEYDNYGSISPSGAVQHDSAFSTIYKTRGNATTTSHWRNTDSAWLATVKTYDDAGNVLTSKDPNNNLTTLNFSDSWANTSCLPSGGNGAAYVTSVTNPKSQVTTYKYNSCTGTMASVSDPNHQTTAFSYDLMNRLVQTNFPDGGQISDCYSDTSTSTCHTTGQISVTRTNAVTSSLVKVSKALVDGVGHVVQTQLPSDPDGADYVDITYDALERKAAVSNPHRSTSSSTDGTTQYSYDALNRTKVITQPDGSQVSNTYSGNQTTVTDEGGKKRKSQMDGLGRLTFVWEDPSGANYETDYQYNALGNLLRMDQKGSAPTDSTQWRTRLFTYDSLSDLLSASNPESGTISYTYDGDGNLQTKTAPKPNQTASATVVTTYSYDALNRLTQKSYNDGITAAVNFGYDGTSLTGCTVTPPSLTDSNPKGARTAMCDLSGGTSWSHDAMGRVATETRTLAGSTNLTKSITYAPYNLDGSVASITYPSTRILTYTPGGAGRPLAVQENAHSINYLINATYTPNGGLSSLQNGASIFGQVTYNPRLQPLQIYYTVGAISPATVTQLQNVAAPACPTTVATLMSQLYNFSYGTTDNGNVTAISDCRHTDRGENFHYDSLNRISNAYTNGSGTINTNWGEVYTVDPWGNLTNIGLYPGQKNSELLNAAAATNKNQLNGFCYDAAGNMTGPSPCPSSAYTYDAENRLKNTAGYTYVYDGDGKRVIKCNGTYPTCVSGTLYWTGTATDTLAETDLTGTPAYEYIFFNGQRVARRVGTANTVHYYFADHLGSTDVVATSIGAIQKESMYYPFGGEISGGTFVNTYKFTGKEHDSESGLDNFGARYNASTMGRFMTPDPLWIKADRMIDPQRLNLYAYGRNNPLKFTDPTGMDVVMGKCSGGDAQKCFNTALKGLPKDDRSHVHLVAGDGKNGFAKGQFGVTVDADYKSSSKNFSILQNLANDHSGVASLNVVGPKDTFSSNAGVQQGAQVVLQSFKSIYGADNYVSSKDAVPGQTLYPLIGSPLANVMYSTGKNAEAYIATDQTDIEIVKTEYHELTHIFLSDFGRSIPKALEDAPGVKPQLNRAEQEAEQNFKQ